MEQYYLQELPYKASPCPWGSFLRSTAWRWGGRAGRSAPGSSGGRLAHGSYPGRGAGSLQVDRWRVAVEQEHSDSTQSCIGRWFHSQKHPVSFPRSTYSFSTTTQCSSHMQKKAPQWSLGMRLGSGSLETRLDTSQIPGSELPPSASLTSGIREWFRGITRGFPLSPTLPPPPPPPFFFFFFFFFFPSPSAPTPAPASGCCGASPGTGWSKVDNEVGNW